MTLGAALADAEVFVDGDWVESEDQDPNGDVRLIQLADVGDGFYVDKSARFLTSRKAAELKCTFLRSGDVLVARMPDPLGRACIFPGDAKAAVTVVDVCVIRPNPRRHDARWLMHCLNSPNCRRQIAALATGTTRSRISRGNLKTIQVSIPSLNEQRRIAEVLDQAEALRARRGAALAQLDTLTQSVFLDLFGDPADNPKKWEQAKLGDAIFSASDGPHVSPSYSTSGIPFLSTRHVRAGEISWHDLKFISREDAEVHWRKCRPQKDDILYTKGGTTGLAARVETDTEFAVWVHIALLKPNPMKVDSVWLEAMLNSTYCYRQSQDLTRGIANRDLGLKRMVNIQLYLPPLEFQREFASRVAAVEKLKSIQRRSLAELDALFVSLQHRAFRGEL